MKLLILTQYFPPEVGAPQNRLFELAIRFQKKGVDMSVLTAMPNYPQMLIHKKYKNKLYHYEEMNGIKVYRSWIFISSRKGIIFRLLNYFSFVFSSAIIGLIKLNKFDYVLCESPPLFLGITGYFLSKIKRAKLIFNVSDLWPESAEKLGLVTNNFFLKSATFLEEFLYKKSYLITGQTQGIVKNISTRFPDKKVYWLPNGVDLDYYNAENTSTNWRKKNNFHDNDFIVLYAGILGYAQGLEVIITASLKTKAFTNIKFVIVGSGPEKEKLMKLKKSLNADNVLFFDAVTKAQMPEIIAASDAAVIPLKKLDLFKGAIPSKLFEMLAMKKPILLGLEGEAKELFIDKGNCGLAFSPEDANDLANQIIYLYNHKNEMNILGVNGYEYVKKYFNRDIIASDFLNQLLLL